jgi:hypothetical protein
MQINWVKCSGENWCPFETVNLAEVETLGVYIVWHEGNHGRVVYVGQGDIKARLTVHRKDARILAYLKSGTLRVTWAFVSSSYRDGVERHLADKWNPQVGDVHPDVLPIAVNSPW